jgi:uncharacterized membrane protein YbhN (UPF0104 family)
MLRRVFPWVVAAAILAYLFRQVPAREAWLALQQARLGVFVPTVIVAVTLWFLLESRAFAYLFSRFNAPVGWGEARSLRALTYIVTPINWNLGTAAIILHLRRSKGIDGIESTSSMLFYMTIDVLVFATLAGLGIFVLPSSPVVAQIARVAAVVVGVQLFFLTAIMARRPGWGWLQSLRSPRLLRTYRLATWRDVAVLAVLRTFYFCGFILFFWIGTSAFNVSVPLGFAMASTPLILMVASLPITPGGLGTQQAAMLYFFSPYGSEAAILAFALAFPVAVMLGRMPIGLLYLRDLAALREPASQDSA